VPGLWVRLGGEWWGLKDFRQNFSRSKPLQNRYMSKQVAEISKEKATQRTVNPVRQRLVSLKNAAKYLDRGEDSLREMIYSGVFPVIQLGERSKIWLDIRDLDNWIDDHKQYLREQ
jgi:tRNA A37 N6-isopentenylltransferase MiaA